MTSPFPLPLPSPTTLSSHLSSTPTNLTNFLPNSPLTPLIACINHVEAVPYLEVLLKHKVDPNGRSKDGKAPLHYAVLYGETEVVRMLVEAGADVDVVSQKDKVSPLHYAVKRNDVICVRLLCESGADVNVQDKNGKTPLHYAYECGFLEIAMELITKGGDLTKMDKRRKIPLMLLESYPIAKHSLYSEYGSFEELSTDISKYLFKEEMSDVRFVIGTEVKIPAHRFIIMCRAPLLVASQEPEITLTDVNENCLRMLLEWIYSANITHSEVTLDDVFMLYKAAEAYELVRLQQYIGHTAISNLTPATATKLLVQAQTHNATHIINHILSYIAMNFKDFVNSGNLEVITQDYLEKILNNLIPIRASVPILERIALPVVAATQPKVELKAPVKETKPKKDLMPHDMAYGDNSKLVRKLLQEICELPESSGFMKPVASLWPQLKEAYQLSISEPMDFGTITMKLRRSSYETLAEFARDMRLVFENTWKFNLPESEFCGVALTISFVFEEKYETLKKSIGLKNYDPFASLARGPIEKIHNAAPVQTYVPVAEPEEEPVVKDKKKKKKRKRKRESVPESFTYEDKCGMIKEITLLDVEAKKQVMEIIQPGASEQGALNVEFDTLPHDILKNVYLFMKDHKAGIRKKKRRKYSKPQEEEEQEVDL